VVRRQPGRDAPPTRSRGRLLDQFLEAADQFDAEVVLHCGQPNVAFYRRHGFYVTAEVASGGQRLMLRKALSHRPRMSKERQHKRGVTTGPGARRITGVTRARRTLGKSPKTQPIDTET